MEPGGTWGTAGRAGCLWGHLCLCGGLTSTGQCAITTSLPSGGLVQRMGEGPQWKQAPVVGNRPPIHAPQLAPVGGTARLPELCSGPSPEPRAMGPSVPVPCPRHPTPQLGTGFWMPPACHQAAGPSAPAALHLHGRAASSLGWTQVCLAQLVLGGGGMIHREFQQPRQLLRGPQKVAQSGLSSAGAPATSPGRLGATSCPSAYLELGAPKLSVPWITPA